MNDNHAPELNGPSAWSPIRLGMDREKYRAQLNEASAKGTADQVILFVWLGMRQELLGPEGYGYLEYTARNTADPAIVVARLVEYAAGMAQHPADARGLGYIIAHYANHLLDAQNTEQNLVGYALELYRAVSPAVEKHPIEPDIGTFWQNRARVHLRTGHLADCVADSDRALAVLRRSPVHTEDVGRALMNRAAALVQLNEFGAARADYEAAIVIVRQYSPPAVLARALKSYAGVLRRTGAVPDAERCYAEAIAMLPADHLEVAGCLMDWGNCLAESGRDSDAIPKYRVALERMRGREQPSEVGRCLMNWGAAHGKLNEWGASEAKLTEALTYLTAPISRMRCLNNLALARHMLGCNAEAVAAWRAARDAFRAARRNAGADDTRLAYYAEHTLRLNAYVVPAALAADLPEDGYEAVLDGKAGAVDDLAAQLARGRADEPADVLAARGELTLWFRSADPEHESYAPDRDRYTERYLAAWGQHARAHDPARAAPHGDDRPTRADLQSRLPDRWALIDFWWSGNTELHAFVLFRDAFQVVKLPFQFTRDALIRLTNELRTVGPNEPALDGLTDLGTMLYVPLLPLLREKQVAGLYLVPHEFLHMFPLHAARWYEKGRLKYLCDEFETAYLPSANLLPKLPAPDPTGGRSCSPTRSTAPNTRGRSRTGRGASFRSGWASRTGGASWAWPERSPRPTTGPTAGTFTSVATAPATRCSRPGRTCGWPTTCSWRTTCCTASRR